MTDLVGRRVGAVEGTTSADFVLSSGARLVLSSDINSALDQLGTSKTEAVVFDRPVLRYLLNQRPDLDFRISEASYQPQDYGFAVGFSSPIHNSLVVALLQIRESGEMQEIVERWLGP